MEVSLAGKARLGTGHLSGELGGVRDRVRVSLSVVGGPQGLEVRAGVAGGRCARSNSCV